MFDLTTNPQLMNTALSIFLGGGAAGILYKIPSVISNMANRFFIMSLTIDNSYGGNNRKLFFAFMKWINSSEVRLWSTKFNYEENDFTKINLGDGVHYFIWKKRFFRLVIETNTTNVNSVMMKGVTILHIETISMSKKPILILFNTVFPIVENDTLYIKYYRSYWEKTERLINRSFDSIILNKDIKHKITHTIDHFLNNKDYYRKYNIPYKLVMLLYGPPGTGKTSIIKAIANYCQRHICVGRFHGVTEEKFINQFYELTEHDMMVIEDIDTISSLKDRKKKETTNVTDINTVLNYATILNVFDGVAELDSQIIIMTTNHIDYLDKAFIRPGRIDLCLEIPLLKTDEIKEYCDYVFPDNTFDLDTVNDISGAQLQTLFLSSNGDEDKFYNDLINFKTANL